MGKRSKPKLNSWIGNFSRVFSAESTNTPLASDASGSQWSSSSGCWSLWWLLRRCGATTRDILTATLANQVALISATITYSPSPTFACGLSSSSLSLALPSWWCYTWPTGKSGNASTEPSMEKTLGCTPTRDKSMAVCGGLTWSASSWRPSLSSCFSTCSTTSMIASGCPGRSSVMSRPVQIWWTATYHAPLRKPFSPTSWWGRLPCVWCSTSVRFCIWLHPGWWILNIEAAYTLHLERSTLTWTVMTANPPLDRRSKQNHQSVFRCHLLINNSVIFFSPLQNRLTFIKYDLIQSYHSL